jgi:hypothetical protein
MARHGPAVEVHCRDEFIVAVRTDVLHHGGVSAFARLQPLQCIREATIAQVVVDDVAVSWHRCGFSSDKLIAASWYVLAGRRAASVCASQPSVGYLTARRVQTIP